MKITWTQVKDHVKRNRTRYIVLGGVALGMAIGYSTKRGNVNTVAQIAKAAKATYTVGMDTAAKVAVNVTPEQVSLYNKVVEAATKSYEALPEPIRTYVLTNGIPDTLKVMVDVDAKSWSVWADISQEIAKQILVQGLEVPHSFSLTKLVPVVQ
jgi:hypothetical protein